MMKFPVSIIVACLHKIEGGFELQLGCLVGGLKPSNFPLETFLRTRSGCFV